jgi:Zn-dependent protease
MASNVDQPPPGRSSSRTDSVRAARIWGVDIRVHWTFLFLLVFVVMAGWGSAAKIGGWLVWMSAVFGSVLVHEYAHCVVARRRGAVVEDILLTPIGGISQVRAMPTDAQDELAIAIVGPLTSFALALVAAVVGIATGAGLWPPTLFAGSWSARVLWLNALLGAFNLLPALPMDGGRVLRSALARHQDRQTATRQATRVARLLAWAMVLIGCFYDLWLVLIGAFVFMGAAAEEQQAKRHDAGGDSVSGSDATPGTPSHTTATNRRRP